MNSPTKIWRVADRVTNKKTNGIQETSKVPLFPYLKVVSKDTPNIVIHQVESREQTTDIALKQKHMPRG